MVVTTTPDTVVVRTAAEVTAGPSQSLIILYETCSCEMERGVLPVIAMGDAPDALGWGRAQTMPKGKGQEAQGRGGERDTLHIDKPWCEGGRY